MGTVLQPSMQLGVYSVEGDRLSLCLAEAGRPRPAALGSRESPYQALAQLVRMSTA
jgi:hypothetical protein